MDDVTGLLGDLKSQIELLSARVEHVHVTLSQKVDHTHDAMVAKVTSTALLVDEKLDGTHREMSQLLQFHGEGILRQQKQIDLIEERHEKFVSEMDKRLVNVAKELMAADRQHDADDDQRFTELYAFRTQVKTVIALLTLLWPLATALLLRWLAA